LQQAWYREAPPADPVSLALVREDRGEERRIGVAPQVLIQPCQRTGQPERLVAALAEVLARGALAALYVANERAAVADALAQLNLSPALCRALARNSAANELVPLGFALAIVPSADLG